MNFWSKQVVKGATLRPSDLIFSDTHSRATFLDLQIFCDLLTTELKRHGISKKDRVLVILPRGAASACCIAALLAANVPALGIERSSLATSLELVVASLDPTAILFLESDRERILARVETSEVSDLKLPFVSRDQIRLAIRTQPVSKVSPPNLGWLLQTSGSTRAPRLVMIDDNNLVARAKGEVRDFRLTPDDQIINALSFTHDVGFNQLLSALASLSHLRIQNQPFASALSSFLRAGGSQGVSATPLLWTQVLAASNEPVLGFRYVAVSGGSMSEKDLRRLKALFPGADVIRTYGQTETFRSLINRTEDFNSLGLPIPGVQLRLSKDDELIHGGEGEMIGYFDAADATKQKMANPGIRTGDLFELTTLGHYRYKGRIDDMIKRFEIRMHLGEVEQAIGEIPEVTAVAVLAKPAPPNDVRENLLAAFVTTNVNSKISKDEIVRLCKRSLEPSKQPDLVEILNEMPTTAGYKIDRAELQRRWNS